MPLEAYATLQYARFQIGQHAKCCSVVCKHLKILHTTNGLLHVTYATCCMTPMLLAA